MRRNGEKQLKISKKYQKVSKEVWPFRKFEEPLLGEPAYRSQKVATLKVHVLSLNTCVTSQETIAKLIELLSSHNKRTKKKV